MRSNVINIGILLYYIHDTMRRTDVLRLTTQPPTYFGRFLG